MATSAFSIAGRDHVDYRGWMADGKGFYVSYDDHTTLYRIDLDGRSRKVLKFPDHMDIGPIRASPDGRHLAFSSVFRKSTVWMMEGF